jgi:hypothetical protein
MRSAKSPYRAMASSTICFGLRGGLYTLQIGQESFGPELRRPGLRPHQSGDVVQLVAVTGVTNGCRRVATDCHGGWFEALFGMKCDQSGIVATLSAKSQQSLEQRCRHWATIVERSQSC